MVNVKDKPRKDKISHVIYGIRCGSENCSETYVGETKQGWAGEWDSIKGLVPSRHRIVPSITIYEARSTRLI